MTEFNIEDRTVFHGDNLEFLRGINSNSVDCVYIDPPFNKKIHFHAPAESRSTRRIQFDDIWRKPTTTAGIRQHMRERDDVYGEDEELSQWLDGVKLIDQDEQEQNYNYLVFMAVRLLECHRILKPAGSFFIHCDDTMSHFLKITLDCIFDEPNFRNEIVWQRTRQPSTSQGKNRINSRMTDKIFWYTKTNNYKYHAIYEPRTDAEIKEEYPLWCQKTKRRYKDDSKHLYRGPALQPRPNLCFEFHGFRNRNPSGWIASRKTMERWLEEGILTIETIRGQRKLKRWKFYNPDEYKGRLIGDLWLHMILEANSKERLSFTTQKPLKLIKRIIESVTDEQDVVVDAFAGSGTTAHAAHVLKRVWAVADQSPETSRYIEKRLGIHVPIVRTNEPPNRTDGGEDRSNQRYVYVIEDITDPGWYKIGIAKDVASRLASLQTGRRDRDSIRVVHKVYTHLYRELEKHCHKKFEHKHEWVKASLPEIKRVFKDFIDSRSGNSSK